MAKSGTVVAAGGNAPLESAVLSQTPPVLNLGQIAASALNGNDNAMVLHIDVDARTVAALLGSKATTASSAIEAGSPTESFTPDAEQKVSQWTSSAQGSVLAGVTDTTAKPSRSLASLISALEDQIVSAGSAVNHLYVDQVTGKLSAFIGPITLGATPDETFTQTVTQASGAVKNAFE